MIKEFFECIAHTIVRHPRGVAALILAVFCTGLYGMTLITMQTGWETHMDKDSPSGLLQAKYEENFQSDSIILIIETADPLRPDVLAYIDYLEADFRQQQNINSVTSITDVVRAYNGGVLPATTPETLKIVNALPAGIRDTVYPSNILTLVQIKLDKGLSEDVQISALDNVASIIDNSIMPPGVTVEISGNPAFSQQMDNGLMDNMGLLIGGALVLMVITMGILFAYVRYRFLPVLFVAIGLVTSLGLMGLAGISLNMAVVGAFPVLIGLGIDYAIQFQARFDEEARKGSLDDAVFNTVTRTGPAVMYAMLATCMGFLAMFISTVPMVRSFGLVSIIGIISCYCLSCIGIPTFGLLLKYPPKQQMTGLSYAGGLNTADEIIVNPEKTRIAGNRKKTPFTYGRFLTAASVKIAKNPIPVLLVAALIALIGFQIDPTIPVDSDEKAFVPADMPAKINIDKVTRIIGATSTADFYIQGARVTDLDTMIWMMKFQDYELSHHLELTEATSIVTYVLQYNEGVMPETQYELDAVLEKIPEDTKTSYISGSLNSLLQFNMEDLTMEEQNTLKEQMIRDIAFLDPPIGITIKPTGDFELFTTMLSSLTNSKEVMTYLGFIMVFVFLIVVYRHLHAVAPIISITFIVGWNAVMMSLLSITYTPLTVTLGSMTIGVAAEYTILVMERYAEEKERLHNPLAAIQESVQKIGTSITISGLATFFGFSALCLATFPLISNFGITTLIAVGFSLTGAIFIMPAALSLMGRITEWFEKRKSRPAVVPETV